MRTILRGALAGAAATWALERVSGILFERESPEAAEEEREARGGESAYATAVGKTAEAAGVSLTEERRERAGRALHWGLGVGSGIAYALARPRLPGTGAGRGVAFGAGFFTLLDELAIPLAGLTPGPTAFPWQAHARGLASHLAYGLTAEAVLQALGDGGRPRPRHAVRIEV